MLIGWREHTVPRVHVRYKSSKLSPPLVLISGEVSSFDPRPGFPTEPGLFLFLLRTSVHLLPRTRRARPCLALLCLFLEAHNMADMCFVIVSTASPLPAYEGCRRSPWHPKKPPPNRQRASQKWINLITHSPFDDDDGHMEYLFLEKRHWGQSKTKHKHITWLIYFFKCTYMLERGRVSACTRTTKHSAN